jgi:phage tail sheath protein FI
MAEYLSPGVYVEEVSSGIRPIEGVGTSTGAFIGVAAKGPVVGAQYEDGVGRPVLVTNFGDFTRTFGSFISGEFLAYAVQQFFAEGGTRCYVARTAHFGNPADPTTLTAARASLPLGGVTTTLADNLTADATQAQLASINGLQEGMHLFINDGTNAARVRVGQLVANPVPITNLTPVSRPAFTTNTNVTQVILDVLALNEGDWGNNLSVAVDVAGLVTTTLSAAVVENATQATLTSVERISVGMTLFISDVSVAPAGMAKAARVQVTRIDAATRTITFLVLEHSESADTGIQMPTISSGASVTGTIAGRAATVLDSPVASGDTEAVLQSTAGIGVGSILLFVAEDVTNAAVTVNRRVVTRVVGRRVFLSHSQPFVAAFPADPNKVTTRVTTEDFTLTVYEGNDIVETHVNLSMENTNTTDYVEGRINIGATRSRFIRVKEAPVVTNSLPPQPTAGPRRLGTLPTTAGLNGDVDAEGDYIGNEASQTGFHGFDSVDDINILAAPGITLRPVILAGMTYCENRADCFFVGEAPLAAQTVTEVLDFKNATGAYAGQQAFNSTYGALYWPWVRALDPLTNRPMSMPPSGAVIGSYSATDVRRGVHKAPAGLEDGFLNTAIGIEKVVTKGEHDLLNPQGVNVIRSFPDLGILIWGARTVSVNPEWRYVNVRRLFLFLEESIDQGTQWVVFEPNDPVLWKRIIRNVSAFLRIQWLEGKLVGNKPEEAFFVKCDEETNPPESVALGRVITLVGVAPSRPAEFVIFRISQIFGGSNGEE